MIKLRYLIIMLVLNTLFLSCSIKKIDNLHGIPNLSNKFEYLKTNKHNSNDIINFLGHPMLNDYIDKKTWYYFEVRETRNLFGKRNNTVNNIIILRLNDKGILSDKQLIDSKSLRNINFDQDETISRGLDNTILKNILSSTKKRMQKATNK